MCEIFEFHFDDVYKNVKAMYMYRCSEAALTIRFISITVLSGLPHFSKPSSGFLFRRSFIVSDCVENIQISVYDRQKKTEM